MTGYARLLPFIGPAGPDRKAQGPRNPEALACKHNVIQELAAVSDSHYSEELPHTAFTSFPPLRGLHHLFSFFPLF